QRDDVAAGGLMSYAPNGADLFRRAAGYVDRILKGAKAGDLPLEKPREFEFVVNLKTAKALRLTLPPSLLLRATEVLEYTAGMTCRTLAVMVTLPLGIAAAPLLARTLPP